MCSVAEAVENERAGKLEQVKCFSGFEYPIAEMVHNYPKWCSKNALGRRHTKRKK